MKQALEDRLSGVPLLWHHRARGEPRGDDRLIHEDVRLSVVGRVPLFQAPETSPARSIRPPSSHLG
jgi:hypothetical protein